MDNLWINIGLSLWTSYWASCVSSTTLSIKVVVSTFIHSEKRAKTTG